jgi:hypothetical protein
MNTLENKYDAIENLIFKEGLKIKSIEYSLTFDKMVVYLTNQSSIVIPISYSGKLLNATPLQLKNYKIIGSGTGIHWFDIDEDLSLKGFLNEFLRQRIKQKDEMEIA